MCSFLTPGHYRVLVDKAAGVKGGDLYIRSVCFSPDGKFLATGAEDKKIRVRCSLAYLYGAHPNMYIIDLGY
jgi:WD40 repeat protein